MHALVLGVGFFALSAALILALHFLAPKELAAMRISDREMFRFAEEGYFPLSAAAVKFGRTMLAFVANAQTFSFIGFVVFVIADSARRGFINLRARGWSNGVWIAGLVFICFAPSMFPGLTPQRLDYAITGAWAGAQATPLDAVYGDKGLNHAMLPAVFIAERGFFGLLALLALAFVFHDLGYRFREALEDFGVIDAEERTQSAAPRAARGHSAGRARAAPEGEGPEAIFGQRSADAPRPAPESPETKARRVLGVSASASRREIERAYRSQMKRAHPDHGGSVERAAALNAARDALLGR